MGTQDNLLGVLQAVWKWKKQIAWVSLATAIGTALISLLFLPNYYRSTTVFFSASPKMAQADIVFGWGSGEMRIYGDDFDTDRVITIAESNEIVDYLVDSFNLFRHYQIDSTVSRARYKVREKFRELYEVKKNKREAIELSLEDKSPELARRMVNAARNKINEIGKSLVKNSQKDLVIAYKSNIREMDLIIQTLSDSLMNAREEHGIFSTTSQSEVYSSISARSTSRLAGEKAKLELYQNSPGLYRDSIRRSQARIVSLEQQLIVLKDQIKQFNDGMGLVAVLESILEDLSERRSKLETLYQQLVAVYTSEINAIHLVEEGLKPIVKSRPRRSIIVLVATFLAVVFMSFTAIIVENYKDVNWSNFS